MTLFWRSAPFDSFFLAAHIPSFQPSGLEYSLFGLGYLAECAFCFLLGYLSFVRHTVGVVLQSQYPVGLSHFLIRGIGGDAQHLVVVCDGGAVVGDGVLSLLGFRPEEVL